MSYKVYTVSTTTWQDKTVVDPKSCSWTRAMNEGGSGSASFNLADTKVASTITKLAPAERCLVVESDDVVIYAGIIWESTYNRDTKTLTLNYDDIWSLIELRLIAPIRTEVMPSWKTTYSGMEYDTIVKRLVQLGTTGAGRTIPMVYEDDYAGGRSRTYYGYNADTVVGAIKEIMDLADGPDVDFRPRWNAARDGLEFTLRTGFMNPDNNQIEVNFSAAKSYGRNLTVKTTARELATQVVGVGEGSGVDMIIRSAGGSGAFAIERAEQAKNLKDGTQLSAFAQGEVAARAGLLAQYGFDISQRGPVIKTLWDLQPGTSVRWYVSDDPYISSGWKDNMILKFSGEITSDWIHFEVI
ncbi:hypothetical protein [Glutamicibacter arilaitensis]|uniref:hypothetical protein n=1 Tax=Glutamicibacter arilaitensis TaxID=256701 RepID=UPI00384B1012